MLLTAWMLLAWSAGAETAEWPKPEDPMELTADYLSYSVSTGLLTANGNVFIKTARLTLRADHLTYDQQTGEVLARGHASLVSGTSAALAERVRVNVRTMAMEVDEAFFMQKRDIAPPALAAITPEQLRNAGKTTLAL